MFSLAALLASAVFVSAAPSTLNARDGCVTAYIESFTLAAFNTSMPNANLTGAPLVLSQTSGGSDVCGSGNASTNFVLSTYASSSLNPYPTLAMSNGAVAAIGSDMRPVASAPAPGDELNFAPLQGDPDNVFCASWSTDGQYIYELSYSGDVNNWALCPAQSGEVNVVYKPDQNHTSVYDYTQCYPVKLHIVQEGGPHPGCQ